VVKKVSCKCFKFPPKADRLSQLFHWHIGAILGSKFAIVVITEFTLHHTSNSALNSTLVFKNWQ